MTLTLANQEKLWDLMKPMKVAMLVTEDKDFLRARPMELVQDEFDGKLYFYTDKDDEKNSEIKENAKVCVIFSDLENNQYISISGKAVVESKSDLIDKYWSPFVAAWFPNGQDQASIIEIDCQRAEYWDSTSSQMKVLYEVAMANLTKSKPHLGENIKMS